jgi:general secretion pathway protein F
VETYSYEAIKKDGKVVTGSVEAEGEQDAAERLQGMDFYPLKIEKPGENDGLFSFRKSIFDNKIAENDTMVFSYQLGVLLEAGFPLDKGLVILSDLTDKKKMKDIIKGVLSSVSGGKSLSDSISKYPEAFTPLYINMVKAGESGGFLEDTLVRLAAYLEDSQRMKSEVKSALVYPALLAIVGGIAIMVLLFFVVPRFSSIFSGMGQALPLSTVLLLNLSSTARSYWWAFFIMAFAIFFSARSYIRSSAGKRYLDDLKYRLPLVGNLFKEIAVAQFARTLGTLLHNGVPLLNALHIVKGTTGSGSMAGIMGEVTEGVRKGNSISGILKTKPIFPKFAVHMIKVGEETGRLDEMLIKVADRFDIEVKGSVKKMLSLLEPALILIMGLVVGFIVISMLLAIFSLNDLPF